VRDGVSRGPPVRKPNGGILTVTIGLRSDQGGTRGEHAIERARDLDRIQPVYRDVAAVDSADFPNARVTYSLVWELWGRQTPDWNAAVGALFAPQGQ
jgi:hypothetical protein